MQNFSLNRQFWFFGPNLTSFKHIQWTPPLNSAYPNCSKYRILDQTYPKRVFPYKAKKVNTTDKFYNIFDLVYVPNFSLKWRFWLFWPNLPKKGISGRKPKNQLLLRAVIALIYYIKLLWGPGDQQTQGHFNVSF